MRFRIQAMFAMGVLFSPDLAFAQTTPDDITFEVPLNLTRLASDITQIDVTCSILSDAIGTTRVIRGVAQQGKLVGHLALNVSQGRLVTTANVVVPVPAGSLLQTKSASATYECVLTGYSSGTRKPKSTAGWPAGWDFFAEKHANPSFQFSPTPTPITGSFEW